MGVLIDASVLVAAERGQLDFREVARGRAEEPVGIATITASELLHGVHRADTDARRHRREAWVESLLAAIPALPFDLTAARIHARLWAQLLAAGVTVGAHDLLVAATALSAGFSVASRDLRSFPRIPGLSLEHW